MDTYSENPSSFLDQIYWSVDKGIDGSFYISENGEILPFLEAPEEIMIPFWLLDMGYEIARMNRLPYPVAKWTPYKLLKDLSEKYSIFKGKYIIGIVAKVPLIINGVIRL